MYPIEPRRLITTTMKQYSAPARSGESEIIVKRSKFIARVIPVDSEDSAKEEIARVKAGYHDARHNCWGYIIHGGPERYSDDGEPQGTAGLPMLEVFKRGGIYNICSVVTRYFGGILLGPGGLSRAYSEAVKLALAEAGTVAFRLCEYMEITCGYNLLGKIKSEIENFSASIESVTYGESAVFHIILPDGTSSDFNKRLMEASAGAVSGVVTDRRLRKTP
jgi:uncharacterized YigZ family protein